MAQPLRFEPRDPRVRKLLEKIYDASVLSPEKHLQKDAAEVQCAVTEILVEALERHATALADAATASDKYSHRLIWATWALVLAAAAQIVVTIYRG